jgi:hypothetical protein
MNRKYPGICRRSELVLAVFLCLTGCAEALPRESPDKAFGDFLLRAEHAAAEAATQAAEARKEAAENARLLQEARQLAAQAEHARNECSANYQRMLDAEKAREAARRRAAAAAARAKAKAEAASQPAVPTPTPVKDPEYSPSDAP